MGQVSPSPRVVLTGAAVPTDSAFSPGEPGAALLSMPGGGWIRSAPPAGDGRSHAEGRA